MFAHPDGIGQLARQHHNQMITDAGQRQLRHRLPRTARSRPLAGARITRRLSAAIARAGVRAEPAGLGGRAAGLAGRAAGSAERGRD